MKSNIVYYENNTFGYVNKNNVFKHDEESLKKYLSYVEKNIKRNDNNRNIFSLGIGICCLIATITFGILDLCKVIKIGLFNFTLLIAGAILAWQLLYYLLGFVFYKKTTIEFHFKSVKSANPNVLMAYNSTNYSKYMDKYVDNKSNYTLYHPDTGKLVTLGLYNKVKFSDRFVFNGKIISNIPYYYLAYKSTRVIFLPGIVIYVNKNNSKVVLNKDFSYSYNDKIIILNIENKEVLRFKCEELFNVNLFNFKY